MGQQKVKNVSAEPFQRISLKCITVIQSYGKFCLAINNIFPIVTTIFNSHYFLWSERNIQIESSRIVKKFKTMENTGSIFELKYESRSTKIILYFWVLWYPFIFVLFWFFLILFLLNRRYFSNRCQCLLA